MNRSDNYNLYLPETSDYRDVSQLSWNFETLDEVVAGNVSVADKTSSATWNTTDFNNQDNNLVCRSGNTVMLKLYPQINHTTTGASVTIGTLPSDCKPFADISTNITVGGKTVTITIDRSYGNIKMYANDNLQNWNMPCVMTFLRRT